MLRLGSLSRSLLVAAAVLAACGCAAFGAPAKARASKLAPASGVAGGRGAPVLGDSAGGSAETGPHRVRVTRSYYVSLCFYGLGQLGFGGKEFNPEYADLAKKMDAMVGDLGFRRPVVKGVFYQLAFQLPAYFDPRSPEETADLLASVRRFVRSGSLDEFRLKWPDETRSLEDWFPGSAKSYFEGAVGGREEVVGQALDMWARFLRVLWPKYEAEYAVWSRDYPFQTYETECNKLGVFEAWQQELGVEYPYADLVLVVCPENTTVASSLGPDKVVFGAMHSLEQMKNSVVHEVGVRHLSLSILFSHPASSALMSADYNGMLRLVQAEVCYRTPRILPGLTRDFFVDGMRLEKLVAWRAKRGTSGSLSGKGAKHPAELLSELYAGAKRAGVL